MNGNEQSALKSKQMIIMLSFWVKARQDSSESNNIRRVASFSGELSDFLQ
jgi:hypothetical protein